MSSYQVKSGRVLAMTKKRTAVARRRSEVVEAELVEDTGLATIETVRAADLFRIAVGTLSENTIKSYAQDVKRFGQWWGEPAPLEALVKLSAGRAREAVLRYQASMVEEGLAKNTVARAIRALNSIVKKLAFAELCPWTLDVPVTKVQRYKDVRGPGQEDWEALLEHVAEDKRWFGPRDLAMFLLLGNDGLRASEVGKIAYPDHVRITEDRGPEVYVQGKGDKDLWQPLHPETWAAIEAWVEVREMRLGGDKPGRLFVADTGRPMSRQSLWKRLKVRAKEAGLKHIHPHQLRHHAITVKAKTWTGPQASLTRWARHSDPRTTQVYIDDVGEDIRKIANLGGRR